MNQTFDKLKWQANRKIVAVLIIIYIIGETGLVLPLTHPWFVLIIPVNILFSFAVLVYFHKGSYRHLFSYGLLVALLGLTVEIIGVNTGFLFGNYTYGAALGLQLKHTPLLIGINWLLLIYCVYNLVSYLAANLWQKSIIGALLMVLYDLFLEPMAPVLGMWQWQDGHIPLQNFIAWFGISFVILVFLHLMKVNWRNPLSIYLFFIQLIFFIDLNIFRHFGIGAFGN